MPRSRRRKRVPPNPHERMQLDARPSDSRTIAVQKQALVYSTCLDTEIVRADGGTVSEARRVSPEQIKRAQSIITRALAGAQMLR